jgi:DNA-binding response OmpR family regulator
MTMLYQDSAWKPSRNHQGRMNEHKTYSDYRGRLDAANVLEAYLRRENFGVILAHDGKAGLEAALTQHPALILLDIMLPGMTGTEILSRLRRESDVPVIMVTAMGEAPDRIGALRFGADDYVVKPYDPGEVVARCRRCYGVGRQRMLALKIIAGWGPLNSTGTPCQSLLFTMKTGCTLS